ncbi:MAG: DNA-directed RNA polymerase subunit beta, partial [Clostridia bacterium]|nr:DNA-directed RNA polymerase subunit beta [Clostridia bacterium]
MVHPVKLGKNTRMSYGKINEVLEMPNLIEIQKDSYQWFIEGGLQEVFDDISPITDYAGNLVLEFLDYSIHKDEAKFNVAECKERDATYAAPLKVKVRLINKETGEIKEQEIFMGDFPLMTPSGTFIINGAERVIVSQLVRSPGIYYEMQNDLKTGKELFSATVIPNRGAWLEYETDVNDVFHVRIDRTRKLPVTTLIRALGYSSDAQINELFGYDDKIIATLEKDTTANTEEALIEIYKKLRPGEPPTVDSARSLLYSLFYDGRRYSLAKVGRYKFNLKLGIAKRIRNQTLAEDVINPYTGELMETAGTVMTRDKAEELEAAGINEVWLDMEGKKVKVFSNHMVDLKAFVDFDVPKITEKVFFPVLKELMDEHEDDESLKKAIEEHADQLVPKHIILEDIMASINYCVNLAYGLGDTDDIDHLGNRRIRAVGELLQNQFRIGLARMERVVRERMSVQDLDIVTPQALINTKPVISSIKEFFGSSQLSQFMDQPNPLAELTHKRRLSALGPGGLSRDRAGFEVRDVHYSHYGRVCPIETPEGPNIGLINSLATFARINQYGFVEAPYRKVDKETGIVTDQVEYMTADVEDQYTVAQANELLDENGRFVSKKVSARRRREISEFDSSEIDYMDVSPRQLVSVATALIPFLENDDANRALMGSNMQRQAVPLLKTDSPIVGTGMEYKSAKDSGVVVCAEHSGVIKKVSADQIVVSCDEGGEDQYKLLKFIRSNQGTCINQKPIVVEGERVEAGDIIADGPSTDNGELALGRNILIGFMTWEGYNYEDAILINEKLVKEDVFTSIHIEEYEAESRDTKLGPEEIT